MIASRFRFTTHTDCEPSDLRAGFTMIELVAAIAIIAVLMSMMLMGVAGARESARRADCTNRMRQLVLATHQFEAVRQMLPSASMNNDGAGRLSAGQRSILHSSGFWRLLPYLGHEGLAKEVEYIAMQGGSFDTTEKMPAKTRVRLSVFLCPSDPVQEGTNYRFNGGSNPTCFDHPGLPQLLRPNGPFGLSLVSRFSSIPGGTSGTAAFSERLKAPSGRYHHRAHIWGAQLTNNFTSAEIDHSLLRSLASELGTSEPSSYARLAGLNWHGGGKLFTIYDHVFTPNAPLPAISAGSSRVHLWQTTGAAPPTSHHRGGVNTAILDGSVRFVADTIDADVWERLGSVQQTAHLDL